MYVRECLNVRAGVFECTCGRGEVKTCYVLKLFVAYIYEGNRRAIQRHCAQI
jgi:hypothetical protein